VIILGVVITQERITITIDKDLLGRVDHTVDKTTIRNRSHAIEELIKKSLGSTKIRTAVVFLGGDNLTKTYGNILATTQDLIDNGATNIHLIYGDFGLPYTKYFQELTNCQIQKHQSDMGSGGGLEAIIGTLPSDFYIIDCQNKTNFNWDKLLKYYTQYCPTLCGEKELSGTGCYVANKKIKKYLSNEFSIFHEDVLANVKLANELIWIP